MENQQFNEAEQQFSAEELTARKEEMLLFYTDSLPYLKAQHEYEKLLADIDHERFRRAQYGIQYAMMMQETQKRDEDSPEDVAKPKERKLKKG